jgi:hypothetical protein
LTKLLEEAAINNSSNFFSAAAGRWWYIKNSNIDMSRWPIVPNNIQLDNITN